MAEITVIVQEKRWRRAITGCDTFIAKTARLVLKNVAKTGRRKCSLAIVLADDKTMQDLNHTYRAKNTPTNVLAFPVGEAGELGDVVLGYETIRHEAKAQRKTIKHHACHMVVHGVLHLLGYDHLQPEETEKMEKLEIKLLQQMHIPNPYASK